MGDIFDILIGPKPFWKKIHPEFFGLLTGIVQTGKKVVWVQGNHDFQLARLVRPLGVHWIDEGELLRRENVSIYLSHGDLADWTEKLHPLWRAFLSSWMMSVFIFLLPNRFAEKVLYPFALKLSRGSRKLSLKTDRVEKARQIFRSYANRLARKHRAQVILLGHSHIIDDHALEAGRYLNFGSWFDEARVGVLEVRGSEINAQVCGASAWLQATSTQ